MYAQGVGVFVEEDTARSDTFTTINVIVSCLIVLLTVQYVQPPSPGAVVGGFGAYYS